MGAGKKTRDRLGVLPALKLFLSLSNQFSHSLLSVLGHSQSDGPTSYFRHFFISVPCCGLRSRNRRERAQEEAGEAGRKGQGRESQQAGAGAVPGGRRGEGIWGSGDQWAIPGMGKLGKSGRGGKRR